MLYFIVLTTVFCIIHVGLVFLANHNINNDVGRINRVINKLKE